MVSYQFVDSHKQISEELRSHFPSARGFSEPTVWCYCVEHNIHKLKGLLPVLHVDTFATIK